MARSLKSGKTVIRIEDLKVSFQTSKGTAHAVNGLSFSVQEGETLCLVGESGAGKSVTGFSIIQLLNNGLPSSKIRQSGSIQFCRRNGKTVELLNASRDSLLPLRGNELSMIYQEPMNSLNPVYCCGEQIAEVFIRHAGISRQEAMGKSLELLEMVGIPDSKRVLQAYPHEISGGMQQRVIIAMALALHPKLLIADEPTTAVDVTIQAQVLNLLKRIQKDSGTSILFITHDIGVVAQLADRVAVMYAGRIVETADVFSIFKNPLHPYTRGLLLATPAHTDVESSSGELETIPGSMPNSYDLIDGCAFRPRCKYADKRCMTLPELENSAEGRQVRCWRSGELGDFSL